MQMEKASSAEDLLQMCLKALEGRGGEADVRERLGLLAQDDGSNGKKKDAGAVQRALLQVAIIPLYPTAAWLLACPCTDRVSHCMGRCSLVTHAM